MIAPRALPALLFTALLLAASAALAQFASTDLSAAQCARDEARLRERGSDLRVLEHGLHEGRIDELLEVVRGNLERFLNGRLLDARVAGTYASYTWDRVDRYGGVGLLVRLEAPYSYCVLVPATG